MPRSGAYIIANPNGFDDEQRDIPIGWCPTPEQAQRIAATLDQSWVRRIESRPAEIDLYGVEARSAGYPGSDLPDFDPLSWDDAIKHADDLVNDASLDCELRREFRKLYPNLPVPYLVERHEPGLRQPVIIAEVAKAANMRSDLLLKRLRGRDYPIIGLKGRYQVELDHVIATLPKLKRRLKTWYSQNYSG